MLSLSMIVRDEEKSLPSCLESVQGFVDEIVILDTGSIDNTVGIAKSFGARVEKFMWTGDFAPARNAALQLVTGDWVLVLDADEQLRNECINELKRLMSIEEALLVNLLRYEKGSSMSPYSSVSRLFRRHSQIYWSLPYHSMVDKSVKEILTDNPSWRIFNCSEPALIHDGYQPKYLQDKSKAYRLRLAMEKILSQHPGDPYASSKLGALEVADGFLEKGIGILRNGLLSLDKNKCFERYNERYELLLHLAIALSEKNFIESSNAYREALSLPLEPRITLGARFNLAALLMKNNNLEEAIQLTEEGTKLAPEYYLGWFNLGIMYRQNNNYASAIKSYEHCINLNPMHAESYRNLALTQLLIGNIVDARHSFINSLKLLKEQGRVEEMQCLINQLSGIIKVKEFDL